MSQGSFIPAESHPSHITWHALHAGVVDIGLIYSPRNPAHLHAKHWPKLLAALPFVSSTLFLPRLTATNNQRRAIRLKEIHNVNVSKLVNFAR